MLIQASFTSWKRATLVEELRRALLQQGGLPTLMQGWVLEMGIYKFFGGKAGSQYIVCGLGDGI